MVEKEIKITDRKGDVKIVKNKPSLSFKKNQARAEFIEQTDTVINIEDRCNQNCIFCSRGGNWHKETDEKIKELILSQDKTVSFEGGEPTLRKDVVKWIDYAKSRGVKEIVLVTNGILLSYKDLTKELIDSGVTLFNINFPAHLENLSDALTRTPGSFKRRCEGIKNLISLGAGNKTRLTFVINSLNYKILPDYVEFVRANFPEIFYIEFNLIKVLGYVEKRKYLVPKLTDLEPYLREAMILCRQNNIRFLSDGIPLCFMDGFEQNSIDAHKLVHGNYTFLSEKSKAEECNNCSLGRICAGPRTDYLEIYGSKELNKSSKKEDEITARLRER